jgi:hypothetical protein
MTSESDDIAFALLVKAIGLYPKPSENPDDELDISTNESDFNAVYFSNCGRARAFMDEYRLKKRAEKIKMIGEPVSRKSRFFRSYCNHITLLKHDEVIDRLINDQEFCGGFGFEGDFKSSFPETPEEVLTFMKETIEYILQKRAEKND